MKLSVDTDSGIVKLGDDSLPGIIQKIRISGSVKFESVQEAKSSKTIKTLVGFDDADVSVDLAIIDDYPEIKTDKWEAPTPQQMKNGSLFSEYFRGKKYKTRYDALAALNAMFRKTEDGAPVIYQITNPHLLARGIRHVVFSSLQSDEEDWGISCSLQFVEHDKKVEKKADGQAKNAAATSTPAKATPPALSALEQNRQRALERKYQK
jgi:hypothetical protein